MKRGMLATIHLDLLGNTSAEALHDLYVNTYADEPFVRVLPLGQFPETRFVSGSNFVDIGLQVDKRTTASSWFPRSTTLGKAHPARPSRP